MSKKKRKETAYHGLIFNKGIGAHVKNTVSKRNDFLPHTSDRAPIRGALKNDSRPCEQKHAVNESYTGLSERKHYDVADDTLTP